MRHSSVIHSEAQFLSMYEIVKLKKRWAGAKILLWGRHCRMTDLVTQRVRKAEKRITSPKQFWIQEHWWHCVLRPQNDPRGFRFYPPGLWPHLWSCLYFLWRVACTWNWIVLSVCFLLVENFLFLSSFRTGSACPNRFCLYKILKNLVGLFVYVLEFIPWGKRFFHRSLLDNPIFIFSFCGAGWGGSVNHIFKFFKKFSTF